MIEKLPLNLPLYTNSDELNISVFGVEQKDAYIDKIGNDYFLIKRPGLKKFIDLGLDKKIDGLYKWEKNGYLYAVSGGKLFEIRDNSGNIIVNLGSYLQEGIRVSFTADDMGNMYFCNGGSIFKYDGTTVTEITDEDAPAQASHVAWIDGFVLANDLVNDRFGWSDINDGSSWTYTSFASAEGNPDKLIALYIVNREIYLVGTRSIEIWVNTGASTPFRRYDGAYMEQGCVSPYAFKNINGQCFFFNQDRNLITLNGRSPINISQEISKELNSLNTVNDATLDYIKILGKQFLLLQFPTEKRCFVYEMTSKSWHGEWCFWNSNNAEYERFRGNCFEYSSNWNYRFFGDREDSRIYIFDKDFYSDDNEIIRTMRRSGNISWGKRNRKRTRSIEFKLLRGQKDLPEVPEMILRFKDDGLNFGSEIKINLGEWGNTYYFARVSGLGTYKTRQYEIVHSNRTPFVLSEAFEDFDILRR